MKVSWDRNRWGVSGKSFMVNRVLHAGKRKTEMQALCTVLSIFRVSRGLIKECENSGDS